MPARLIAKMLMIEHWKNMMARLGFSENMETFREVVTCYGESHRFYHNVNHIEFCLEKLKGLHSKETINEKELPFADSAMALIEVAIWFHDVIYKPSSSVNEELSAEKAAVFLKKNNIKMHTVQWVCDLIMATKNHSKEYTTPEIQLMLDIDLSILGASSDIFAKYEADIRKEYRSVPSCIYKRKRKAVLQRFNRMPRIFRTNVFFKLYERQARINLSVALDKL